MKYEVRRKLQEQSGSYFVILPKIWVESQGLKEGDLLRVEYDGTITIRPVKEGSCHDKKI
jgi:antitoxin component of MazEF toxin-antitoxin module